MKYKHDDINLEEDECAHLVLSTALYIQYNEIQVPLVLRNKTFPIEAVRFTLRNKNSSAFEESASISLENLFTLNNPQGTQKISHVCVEGAAIPSNKRSNKQLV